MKKLFFYIVFTIITIISIFAQEPIMVNVTGDCSSLTGEYEFTGLINGKNNYSAEFIMDGETVQLQIGFDGTKWVFYIDNDIDDFGFFNVNDPNDELPPYTDWQVESCYNGTLVIGNTASTADLTLKNDFIIYQTDTFLNIKIINSSNQENFKLDLYDILGRQILSKKFNNTIYQINISSVPTGIYFVKINNTTKKILIK